MDGLLSGSDAKGPRGLRAALQPGWLHGFPGVWTALLWTFLALTSVLGSSTAFSLGRQAAAAASNASTVSHTTVPDYFQTDLGYYGGPTATGQAPFLAATNPAPFPSVSYVPNQPLETQVPIVGNKDNGNIFQMMGHLSHYFPNPEGFGVDEYPLPPGANITLLNMLSRHGSRYPTEGSGVYRLAKKIGDTAGSWQATGPLSFLNQWKFQLGGEILVPVGKQELFDSGTLHYYQYGHLYPNDGSKIIVRSTTQDRMTQSAEYFLAGFFGLGWTQNATLERIIEWPSFNNSLAGYLHCTNANGIVSSGGRNATKDWIPIYLNEATERIQKLVPGFKWTAEDSYDAQNMCAYETVALGYSAWCGLFTYEEWEGFEYSIDLYFTGDTMFQSPTGRAVGIGYVQEVLARLEHHLISKPTAQVNVTLDSSLVTFPLDQSLYFDFSHDTNIASILTAFGFTQFAPLLPKDHMPSNRSVIISHLTPFAARLDIEIIQAPSPVSPSRSESAKYLKGGSTSYIHFILNQRTIPLHASFPECEKRDDGWCELGAFLDSQKQSFHKARYDYSCFGDYQPVAWGDITDGAPVN